MDSLYEQSLHLLRKGLKDPSATFYEGQWEAIETIVRQRGRLLLVQRTGWGKVSFTSLPRASFVSLAEIRGCLY